MSNIRRIFLSPSPNFALMQAADLLGMTFAELKQEIADGAIVAVSTRLGQRVTKDEMIATAMRIWEQGVIEEALGDEAAAVLPEAIRLVELRARVPRYQGHALVLRETRWEHGRSRAGARARGRGVRPCGGVDGAGGGV